MNPFAQLGKKPESEEVEGEFTCQQCFMINTEARYFDKESLIVWKCERGHINSVNMTLT